MTAPKFFYLTALLCSVVFYGCHETPPSNIFTYSDNLEPRWSSPENPNGQKGAGGKENNSAKGHPYDSIPAGKSLSLLDIEGQGIIHRIWITINDRTPEMLRALKIEMFWDGETTPAVSV